MAKRDYYDVLGLSRDASQDVIKSSFKSLAKKWHPDKNPDNKIESEEKFKEISEAYSVLSDETKRKQYDQFGHDSGNQSFSGHGGFSADDIMSQFFGRDDFFGGMGQRENKPESLQVAMEITLEESFSGVKKKIELNRKEVCKKCSGKGAVSDKDLIKCQSCNGQGKTKTQRGPFVTINGCRKCNGVGKINKSPCKTCSGEGLEIKPSIVEIEIPSGIDDGTRFRMTGDGSASINGQRGDLYVVVKIKDHDVFFRKDNDILMSVPIPYTTVVLGGEIEVKTIDGKAKLTIPKGTQCNKVFKLSRLGMPDVYSKIRGDQLIKVNIEVPTKLTSKQEEVIKKLAELEKT